MPPGFSLIKVADGVVYLGTLNSVYALMARTGKLLWHTQVGEESQQVAVIGNTLLLAASEGTDGPGTLRAWRL